MTGELDSRDGIREMSLDGKESVEAATELGWTDLIVSFPGVLIRSADSRRV